MSKVFEQAYLPESEKEHLCRNLLVECGVTDIRQRKDELIHGCLINPELHNDQARNPTASLCYSKLVYNCLSGETRVKTRDGEFPISELAGDTHLLVDGNGKWVPAPVKEYGTDRLYRVTLSRNGVQKEIYATANHRWYIRPKGHTAQSELVEITTLDLRPRHRIPSVWPHTRTGRTTISPIGVMRGFVYGDGSATKHGAHANFCGEKDLALLPWFHGFSVKDYGQVKKIASGLPRSWKTQLPDLDDGASALYGWLAGYFAADGCVADDGHVTLACASRETLERVIAICDRLGVATYTLNRRVREGKSGGESEIFSLSFRGSTLTPEFFLIPQHRRRYEEAQRRRKYERTNWWVVSVEETDRVEPVYCAEVPTTHSFVLADNVLTGNCFGCGAHGGLLWFIATMRKTQTDDARRWLEKETGTGGQVQELSKLLYFLESLETKPSFKPVIPRYSPKTIEPWLAIHPALTTGMPEIGLKGKHIPEENLMRLQVGWNRESDRLVFPHFWKGDLVGWQTRRIWDDGSEKYKNTPDFPKDYTIYNAYPAGRRAPEEPVLVVESVTTVLKHVHAMPITSTFGAEVTEDQLRILARYPKVVLWPDNDKSGWKAMEVMGEYLRARTAVRAVESPYTADPGDLPTELVLRMRDESAVSVGSWRRPKKEDLVKWEED